MRDWIYDALQSFQSFMDEGSPADVLIMLAVSAVGTWLLVAVHECGHALAAVLTGTRVRELRVGQADDVTLAAGAFRLKLGRFVGKDDVGGYVTFDGASMSPLRALAIVLAGPGANLLSAVGLAALAAGVEGPVSVSFYLWTFGSLAMAIGNLRPQGDPASPATWSDGRWAQVAWAARREPVAAADSDPNSATSVPPPGYAD